MHLIDSKSNLLRQPTQKIDLNNEQYLIAELTKLLYTCKDAAGIAASQVGECKSLFLIYQENNRPLIFANSNILEYSENCDWMKEGCLSFPGTFLNVRRSLSVSINFQTIENDRIETCTKSYNDFIARVIQHEYDHTLGITFNQRRKKWKW